MPIQRRFCLANAARAATERLSRALATFRGDNRGSIVVAFAIWATVLLTVSGGAIDASRVYSAQQSTQSALDAAVLSGAQGILIANLKSEDEIGAVVRSFFEENVKTYDVRAESVEIVVGKEDVTATAMIDIETPFFSMARVPSVKFRVHARAEIAPLNLEIALVVDTTGSMQINGHVGNVTNALNDLITDLEPLAPKLALVPFAETVNLGEHWKPSWIDIDGRSPTHGILFDESKGQVKHHDMFAKLNLSWNGCVEMRPVPYDISDEPPTSANPSTQFVPFFSPAINPYGNYFKNGYVNLGGIGVVRDPKRYSLDNLAKIKDPNRQGDYDPVSNCPLNSIVPLTSDYSAIRYAINGLVYDGGTNIPSGMSWGWHVLSPGEPFTEGASYSDKHSRKIMILVSDGKNDMIVETNGYGMFYDGRLGQSKKTWNEMTPLVNARMDKLCQNIKDAGVTIYVVSYALPTNAETELHKQRMDKCASSPESHFDAATPDALRSSLARIVQLETPVRLAE